MPKPLVIDLFCGMFGWSAGFLANGYRSVGFDILHEDYHGDVPENAELVLQDVLTLHGSQFKDAACIVCSCPCQEYSYMAMPWSRAKQIAGALRCEVPFPEGYKGSRTIAELNALFNACFRIQREACEAAGRYIPMVVENVKGAQPWVGPARANFGSFYFWGDIEMVGDRVVAGKMGLGCGLRRGRRAKIGGAVGDDWFTHHNRDTFVERAFANSDDGRKVPGFRFDGNGGSFQSAAVKVQSLDGGRRTDVGKDCGVEGVKGMSGLRGLSHPNGTGGRDLGGPNDPRRFNSKSDSRKAASAQIAKIPFALSSYIARAFKP